MRFTRELFQMIQQQYIPSKCRNQLKHQKLNKKATNLQDRSLYFSSFESFFFDLTLATVSKTAWATQKLSRRNVQQKLVPNEFKQGER
jgi:hypothetical protein